MNKNIFKDYIDACELEKELEERIRKLEEEGIAHDVVSGSNPYFPFQAQHFHVEGETKYSGIEAEWIKLSRQKEKVKQIRQQVEEEIEKAPLRIQRIIQYKYIEGATWEEVASRLGRKSSGESVRKEFNTYLKK